GFVGLIDRLVQLIEERGDPLARDIHVLQGRPDNRAILVQHPVKIDETRGNVPAILIVEQIVNTGDGDVQLFNAVIEIGRSSWAWGVNLLICSARSLKPR